VATHSPDEITDLHSALDDFDAEEYAEHEKEIIEDLDYCLAAP